MQTYPHCHNVLVTPMCCTHAHVNATSPRVPVVFAVDPGSFQQQQQQQHQQQQQQQQQVAPLHHQMQSFFVANSTTSTSNCHSNSSLIGGYPESVGDEREHEDKKGPNLAPTTGSMSGLSSLPTPHVSGHMFHFPSSEDNLAQRINACQLTCCINCLTHGALLCPPSVTSTDNSSFYSHQRQSGGWSVFPNTTSLSGDEDSSRLESSKRHLKQSCWYWAKLTWQEAEVLLQPTSIGTFLMRDSADPHHRFSLSVQTEKGPTSVRIHFARGKFRLKCEASVKASLPEFSCVIKLIEYYVTSNEKYDRHVWVDSSGKIYSPIRINRPLYKAVPPLKHLCRKAINFSFSRHILADRMPVTLLKYIDEYPYWC